MNDKLLSFAVCVPAVLLIAVAAAIVGMRSRLRFARRLSMARKDSPELRAAVTGRNAPRIRALAALGLLSTVGAAALLVLLISGLVSSATSAWIVFAAFLAVGILAGTMLLVIVERAIK
jgi:hypothetical protein